METYKNAKRVKQCNERYDDRVVLHIDGNKWFNGFPQIPLCEFDYLLLDYLVDTCTCRATHVYGNTAYRYAQENIGRFIAFMLMNMPLPGLWLGYNNIKTTTPTEAYNQIVEEAKRMDLIPPRSLKPEEAFDPDHSKASGLSFFSDRINQVTTIKTKPMKITYKTFKLKFHKATMCIVQYDHWLRVGFSACSNKDEFNQERGQAQALAQIERHNNYIQFDNSSAFDTPVVFKAFINNIIRKVKRNPHEYLGWYKRRKELLGELVQTQKHLLKLQKKFKVYDPS